MTAAQAIETLLDTDALIVRRTQSRTLLRFAPPDALDPRVGIKVELGAARLDMRVDGRLFETGPARIVGLWSEDEGWRWPWHDAHIPRAATADVEAALRTHADLSPWLGPEPIAMPELETAMQLERRPETEPS